MGGSDFTDGVSSQGIPLLGGSSPAGLHHGIVRFIDSVDGNDSYDGRSWANAYKTLTYGFNATDDAMTGAERATVYCRGSFTENLTKLVSKADIIGCGSKSNRPMPRIRGKHIIADEYNGTRLWNLYNEGDQTVAYNWEFQGGGFEIHNCIFRNRVDASGNNDCYGAITVIEPSDVKIWNSQFLPHYDMFYATAAINIETPTTNVYNCQIFGNQIWGTKGIFVNTDGAYVNRHCHIKGNDIFAKNQCVDDDSNQWYLTRNNMISWAAKSTLGNVLDYNAFRAVGNYITGSDGTLDAPNIG